MNVHYRIHKRDKKFWGTLTLCRKNGSMSTDLDSVTCPGCLKQTSWSIDRFLNCRADKLQL